MTATTPTTPVAPTTTTATTPVQTDVDVLDNKQVGACLAKINNQIIKMRFGVKSGKAWALKGLAQKIRKIRTEKTKKDERKAIKVRKMARLEEEAAVIKALDCDVIALYALERVRDEDLLKVMGSDPPMDRRAKARVAHTKNVKEAVVAFAENFPEYSRYIALFAARKEKGVGAKKHSKGKKKAEKKDDNAFKDKAEKKKSGKENDAGGEKDASGAKKDNRGEKIDIGGGGIEVTIAPGQKRERLEDYEDGERRKRK